MIGGQRKISQTKPFQTKCSISYKPEQKRGPLILQLNEFWKDIQRYLVHVLRSYRPTVPHFIFRSDAPNAVARPNVITNRGCNRVFGPYVQQLVPDVVQDMR